MDMDAMAVELVGGCLGILVIYVLKYLRFGCLYSQPTLFITPSYIKGHASFHCVFSKLHIVFRSLVG